MEISKQTAMSLIKVLCHYDSLTKVGASYPVIDNIDSLLEDFENYVLGVDDDKKTLIDTLRVIGDVYPESLCELASVNGHVNNSSVGDSGADVNLSFRKVLHDEAGEVDTFLMIDGGRDSMGPVTYIRMFDRELQIATGQGTDRTWHYFDIENVPSSWTRLFGQDNCFFRIINWQ
jgi:hypothetical protein